MIELSDITLSKIDINEAIKKNIEICEGFVCDKVENGNIIGCGNSENKIKISYISMLPEIIPIIFTKYNKKTIINFPEFLTFNKLGGGELKYKLVAQSEHSGSMGGGHYYAIAQRKDDVYLFNDGSYSKNNFNPTLNTYMIFYHYIK